MIESLGIMAPRLPYAWHEGDGTLWTITHLEPGDRIPGGRYGVDVLLDKRRIGVAIETDPAWGVRKLQLVKVYIDDLDTIKKIAAIPCNVFRDPLYFYTARTSPPHLWAHGLDRDDMNSKWCNCGHEEAEHLRAAKGHPCAMCSCRSFHRWWPRPTHKWREERLNPSSARVGC